MLNKFSLIFLLIVSFTALIAAVPQGGDRSCGVNQEFTNCGTACPARCGQSDGPSFCTLQCIIGCQCRRGYLLNKAGQCVEPKDC